MLKKKKLKENHFGYRSKVAYWGIKLLQINHNSLSWIGSLKIDASIMIIGSSARILINFSHIIYMTFHLCLLIILD